MRYAGPTTVQRGAALETDWRTGMKAAIQLRTGAARRLPSPSPPPPPLVKVRVTGADNSTQIRIGLREGGETKPNPGGLLCSETRKPF